MDDILDSRWHSFVIQHDDKPPLVVVNRASLPRATLPTLLSFSRSHAFRDGSPSMIWDANSCKMEEPNVNEREQVTGFHTSTTIV